MQANITGIGWITAKGMGRGRDHHGFALPMGPLPAYNPEKIFTDQEATFLFLISHH